MFEVEDLMVMEEFLKKMRDRNIIYEYEINVPKLSSKEYFDTKEQKVKEAATYTQRIEINLYKENIKEDD